ncbi:MAG: alpha/beta fold hydrolase [Planctomycetes bacterium]|nr:alpha/beta fold hydrolase [Planctomycetota bacterium]
MGGAGFGGVVVALAALQAEPPKTAPQTISAVYAPGETAVWAIEQGGLLIGHAWWDCHGRVPTIEPPLHRFHGGYVMGTQSALGLLQLRASGEVLLDDRGRPHRVQLRSDGAGVSSALEVTVANGRAEGALTVGPKSTPIALAVRDDAFLLVNNWIGLFEVMVRLAAPADGQRADLLLFHPETANTLPLELRSLGNFDVRRGETTVSGRKFRDSLGEMLRVLPDGRLYEVDVVAQGVRMRRTDEPFERFDLPSLTPPAQRDFVREEVAIERGGWQLAGTITRPRKAAAERLPALFFLSGSGPQDRDGMSGGIDLGTHELLDHLTEAGFLVLRVDDRGVGGSGAPREGLTLRALADDALACVDFLRARADVEPAKLFLIGHSEGGVTAPIVACERPLAGIVLMAAPGRSLAAVLRDQKRAGLQAAGLPEALIEAELVEHARFLELVAAEGELEPDEVRIDYRAALRDREWLRSHARHDPVAQLAKVTVPVLIAQGGKDVQVSAERDAPPLLAALQAAGHADASLALFPQLDHLFKAILSDPPTTADYLKARPIDPEFLGKVTEWLLARSR